MSCWPDFNDPANGGQFVYGTVRYANGGLPLNAYQLAADRRHRHVQRRHRSVFARSRCGDTGRFVGPYVMPVPGSDPVQIAGRETDAAFEGTYAVFPSGTFGHPDSGGISADSAWLSSPQTVAPTAGTADEIDLVIPSPPEVTGKCLPTPGSPPGTVTCDAKQIYEADSTQDPGYTWTWPDGSTSVVPTSRMWSPRPLLGRPVRGRRRRLDPEHLGAGDTRPCSGECFTVESITTTPDAPVVRQPFTVHVQVFNNSPDDLTDVYPLFVAVTPTTEP